MNDTGRNEPCHCGSGKKYKKCCLNKQASSSVASLSYRRWRKVEGRLEPKLLKFVSDIYPEQTLAVAWHEYWLWPEDDAPDFEESADVRAIFLSWFLYSWEFTPADFKEFQTCSTKSELQALAGSVCHQYIARYPLRLDAREKLFIETAGSTYFSFYRVEAVIEGQSLGLKDLLTGKDIVVDEQKASVQELCGSALYTRVITLDGMSMMFGTSPQPISPHMIPYIIDFKQQTLPKRVIKPSLKKYRDEIRHLAHDLTESMFERPELTNTDGEIVRSTIITFKLLCTPEEAADALASLADSLSAKEIRSTVKYDKAGALFSVDFPWLKPDSHSVMGTIDIKGDQLVIDVLSNERSMLAQKEVEQRLGDKAKFMHAVSESLDSMLEDDEYDEQEDDDLMQSPEIQKFIQEHTQKHYADWLDTALPALHGQTPRKASKSAAGRELLEAILCSFEFRNMECAQDQKRLMPDVKVWRKKLGM